MLRFAAPARTLTAFALVIALAGCTAQSVSDATSQIPTKTATASPTPLPTPTVMTLEESAAAYKAGACRVNAQGQMFNQVWTSGSGDIGALRQAAATARDAMSTTATALDQGKWPEELRADIALVRDADFAQASILAQIATAPNWDSAMTNAFPALTEASAASQRLRSRLGLPADPSAC
ncbi:hypothetical protein [Leifsonia shinshuensis]|uniref:DUF4439 domain-containing protein n=1 Tax=Leifsonia shinshuensis TaxID=150026 RepID=A0A853D106_9MICO|nr:hypothetical protein [Leifsonia shinshuensis]NYJ24435.1 hypothetical protein [Leifsonia shinshuensis]